MPPSTAEQRYQQALAEKRGLEDQLTFAKFALKRVREDIGGPVPEVSRNPDVRFINDALERLNHWR